MISQENELRLYTELCPPAFPKTLPTEIDPAGYQQALERYTRAVEDAIIIQGNGTTIFQGGPMDYEERGIDKAWLTPAIVQDEKGFSVVHMIHLYGSTWDNPGDIHFAAASDADLMLDNALSPDVEEFQRMLDSEDKTPRTVLRFSSNGNTFYPYVNGTNNTPSAEVLAHRLEKMERVLGREIPVTEDDLRKVEEQKRKVIGRVDGFDVLEPHIAETPFGQFYLYGMVNPEDPWQYYELLTPQEIEKIDPSTKIFMRLDSGCDTGQCYHDEGCECREQLHSAMELAMEDNGLLLLAPSHNGRGYGLITKLLTEGAKQGIPMGYNDHFGRKLNTVEAAKALFGERYDIRTFEGTANILLALGITKVHLFTDNVPKTKYLQEAGIEVVRVPTKTKNKISDKKLRHVAAKHEEELYYND